MANVDIRVGYKDLAWFTANPTLILKEGQAVYLQQTGTYKLGDGVTALSALSFLGGGGGTQNLQDVTDEGSSTTNEIATELGFYVRDANPDTLIETTINQLLVNDSSLNELFKVDRVNDIAEYKGNEVAVVDAINTATDYPTPLDDDKLGIWDVVNGLFKSVTWLNIKATLKTYFDAIYATKPTIIDDSINSTLNGWSSTTTKSVIIHVSDKIATAFITIDGTSNSANATITFSSLVSSSTMLTAYSFCRITNNGAIVIAAGSCAINPSSSTIICFLNWGTTLFTGSGTKRVQLVITFRID